MNVTKEIGHMIRARLTLLLALALLLGGPRSARPADNAPCPEGMPRVGDLGFRSLDCDCTFQMSENGTSRRWRFRDEPHVSDVSEDGPAAGILRENDVIVSIDGLLITTSEAGRRLANVMPGVPVTLVVRRDGRETRVRITPGSTCLDNVPGAVHAPMPPMPPMAPMAPMTPMTSVSGSPDVPTPPSAPAPPAAPQKVQWYGYKMQYDVPAAPHAPHASLPRRPSLPRGWYGVSLDCSDCGSEMSAEDRAPVWTFGDLPQVNIVEPGSPAARAGVQRGDVLVQINGVSLLTPEGGKMFGAVKPGQTVKWTLVRGGSKRDVNIVVATRPEDRAEVMADLAERLADLRDMRGQQQVEHMEPQLQQLEMELDKMRSSMPALAPSTEGRRLRYAGSVGGSDVEVRGLGNVVVDDNGDEIVITTRDATIHIRPSAKDASKADAKRPAAAPAPPKK